LLALAQRARPLTARALEEGAVLRVVDHAAGVGIFPVDAYRMDERFHTGTRDSGLGTRQSSPPESRVPSPGSRLGASPRWVYAFAVAMRPLAVRTRNPCWIR